MEGPDDMPAHIKTALTASSLSIPVTNGSLMLGTWQGVYLWEHRHYSGRRELVVHLGA
jgi:secondary thiamine-phosphate synthase enzyme